MILRRDYTALAGLSRQGIEYAIEAFEKAGAKSIGHVDYLMPYIGVTSHGFLANTSPSFQREIEFEFLLRLGWDGSDLPPKGAVLIINDLFLEEETETPAVMEEWAPGDLIECIDHQNVQGEKQAVFWNRRAETASALMKRYYWEDSLEERLATFLRKRGCENAENFAKSLVEEGWVTE